MCAEHPHLPGSGLHQFFCLEYYATSKYLISFKFQLAHQKRASSGVEMIEEQNSLADRIYEAAVLPEFWPSVLRGFAQVAECRAAALVATTAGISGGSAARRWPKSSLAIITPIQAGRIARAA
jgi:hypothetical protein